MTDLELVELAVLRARDKIRLSGSPQSSSIINEVFTILAEELKKIKAVVEESLEQKNELE